MAKSAKDLPKWRVTRLIGARASEICELRAKNADDAIKRAVREYGIEPERQKRLAAYRVA
jgi:hypothetical protein